MKERVTQFFLNLIKQLSYRDAILLVPLCFLALTIPYWNEAPVNDPMVIYRETSQFVTTGFRELMNMGYTVHPPLINLWVGLFFVLFGKAPLSYVLSGVVVYLGMLFFLYFYLKKQYSWFVAAFVVVALFSHPLIVINAVYLSNDLLLLALVFVLLVGFIEKKWYLQLPAVLLLGIAKETGIIVVCAVIAFSVAQLVGEYLSSKKFDKEGIVRLGLSIVLFLLSWGIWQYILRQYHQTEWRDMIFNPMGKSSFVIVFENIVQGKFINEYLTGNLLNIGVLYYNWVYSGLFVIASGYSLWRAILRREDVVDARALLCLGLATIYILGALSFPTWTVIRYGIPVLGLLLMMTAIVFRNTPQVLFATTAVVLMINGLGLYFSDDPVTKRIYPGSAQVLQESFYNIPYGINGPDRINYNMSILKAAKRQNDIIRTAYAQSAEVIVGNCIDLKFGEKVWSVSVHNEFYPRMNHTLQRHCINWWDLPSYSYMITGKKVLIPAYERLFFTSQTEQLLQQAADIVWY